MKLNYFDLLSPEPVYIQNVGNVISPKLSDIASIGNMQYQYYLSMISMDLRTFLNILGQEDTYETFSPEEKLKINIPQILFTHSQFRTPLQDALNFFFIEDVIFSEEYHCFVLKTNGQISGYLTWEQFPFISEVICQRNGITSTHEEDLSKVKNKKALEIMKKLQKGKANSKKQANTDANMELGNIISAVANKSETLNILNIWDLTIFQLWDSFMRLCNNEIYQIQSMRVAAWGDKDKHFDTSSWFRKITS